MKFVYFSKFYKSSYVGSNNFSWTLLYTTVNYFDRGEIWQNRVLYRERYGGTDGVNARPTYRDNLIR